MIPIFTHYVLIIIDGLVAPICMESSLGCRPTIRDLNVERLVDVT